MTSNKSDTRTKFSIYADTVRQFLSGWSFSKVPLSNQLKISCPCLARWPQPCLKMLFSSSLHPWNFSFHENPLKKTCTNEYKKYLFQVPTQMLSIFFYSPGCFQTGKWVMPEPNSVTLLIMTRPCVWSVTLRGSRVSGWENVLVRCATAGHWVNIGSALPWWPQTERQKMSLKAWLHLPHNKLTRCSTL